MVCAAGKRSSGGSGGGKRAGAGSKQQRQGKGKEEQRAAQPTSRSKTAAMVEFKADEILMFDPVPAARGALQVGSPSAGRAVVCAGRLVCPGWVWDVELPGPQAHAAAPLPALVVIAHLGI